MSKVETCSPGLGFNRNHPELREGEVFLGNFTPPLNTEIYPYPSCRVGEKCFKSEGMFVEADPSWRPVFAQLSDLEAEAVRKVREVYCSDKDFEKFNATSEA